MSNLQNSEQCISNYSSSCASGGVSGVARISGQFGLHARPAAQLVKLAQQFDCTIKLSIGSTEVDAKSILDILSLAAGAGAELKIKASGEGQAEALEAIIQFFKNE